MERKKKGEREEEDISREEMKRITEKLKERKSMGMDGVPNEVWKYREEKMVK